MSDYYVSGEPLEEHVPIRRRPLLIRLYRLPRFVIRIWRSTRPVKGHHQMPFAQRVLFTLKMVKIVLC